MTDHGLNTDGLKRFSIEFRSIYGDSVVNMDCIVSRLISDILWARFCRLMVHDGMAICIDYMKKFWYIESIHAIDMCNGCRDMISNQLAHMDLDGCLSIDNRSDPDDVNTINAELVELFKM